MPRITPTEKKICAAIASWNVLRERLLENAMQYEAWGVMGDADAKWIRNRVKSIDAVLLEK